MRLYYDVMILLLWSSILFAEDHILTFIDPFPIIVFAPIQLHINDLELLRTVPGTEFQRTSFSCSKKSQAFRFCVGPRHLGPGPMVPLGPMGPSIF